jgi:hypothetical protein
MVYKASLKIYARGVVLYHFLFFPRGAHALKIRQINSAILKVPDAASSCYVRIPAAKQFPWNFPCLTPQCGIGNLKVKSIIRVISCRVLYVP